MQLIERDSFIATLSSRFNQTSFWGGHCFFICGEAGIGKTSLVRAFLIEVKGSCFTYTGNCDSLFTPPPLAPLYDISLQLKGEWADKIQSLSSRADLFSNFLKTLISKELPVVLVFEDIHWADEATFDFIKFLARRIGQTKCLFLLTYRDNEIDQQHPLRNMLGELDNQLFTQLSLPPLTKQSVQKMADEKGYDGEDVFSISGGNPFYVNEILASYSSGVPDSVRNATLSIYNRQVEKTKKVWQLLSVIPEGIELDKLSKINRSWLDAIEDSLTKGILVLNNRKIFFKHELYRRAIESNLPTLKRIGLNKYMLELFLKEFVDNGEIERIVHYAKNSNENGMVAEYAPIAAKNAASVGAHIQAARLYLTAIEFTQKSDVNTLVVLYENYAYECYLTNQIKNGIVFLNKALKIRKDNNELVFTGNNLRFLSRLWWFEGNRNNAEDYGKQAIDVLENHPDGKAKAMAFSNMCQLKMLSDETEDCLFWGEKALAIARKIGDEETKAHALNSMSSTLTLIPATSEKGLVMLKESLAISLKNSFHEHVARAYTNMSSNSVTLKKYSNAKEELDEGIHYCQENDLNSWKDYMLTWKARLYVETGLWDDANSIAVTLLKNANQPPVVRIGALTVLGTIKVRKGDLNGLDLLLKAKKSAIETRELQRIIPVYIGLMEYAWIFGKTDITDDDITGVMNSLLTIGKFSKKSLFYFWLRKSGKEYLLDNNPLIFSNPGNQLDGSNLLAFWERIGAPYETALLKFEGNEEEKKSALLKILELGGTAAYEKMKKDMHDMGIKKIPRGERESTRNNPAKLTTRELDVLFLLQKGSQNKEIAEALFISPKTVDHHISSLLFKLGVKSRSKAVLEATKLGILV